MPPLPRITGRDAKKPLGYDPARGKYLFFDEIVSKKERIVPVDTLSPEDQKRLVIKRKRAGPEVSVQVMSGRKYSRSDIIREIEDGTEFGKMSVQAEIMYLTDLLKQINDAL